eukprot:2195333-Lingulodinium_polyedra.AAC.1
MGFASYHGDVDVVFAAPGHERLSLKATYLINVPAFGRTRKCCLCSGVDPQAERWNRFAVADSVGTMIA